MRPAEVSVIIYDIDNFKSYNDHYSHIKGDAVLKRVAESVVKVLERHDSYLFRFGGEEFVVVLPYVDMDGAMATAERLRKYILAPGNSTDRGEAYRQFRGRDPDVNALLKGRGFPTGK